VFAGEFDETTGDDPTPMSPRNHIDVRAEAALLSANAMMKLMNIVFMVISLVV
jgi:hypothetical protein